MNALFWWVRCKSTEATVATDHCGTPDHRRAMNHHGSSDPRGAKDQCKTTKNHGAWDPHEQGNPVVQRISAEQ